ncbi:MAG: alpha/beta fold hydrolase [Pseudomonadota bacterium]
MATLDAELAAAEAQVPDLRPGCAKRIIWAGGQGRKTTHALLYVHGFSASPEELRPLPDVVAAALGANAHFTRLTGHGQTGTAMAQATFADWQRDVATAIEIARTIGDQVVLMGCSTGCTLATLALAGGAQAKAMIHISPNFGLRNRAAQLVMDMPGVKHWGHLVAGRTRQFTPINNAHKAFWTTEYPTQAVHPMADAVRAVRRADLGQVQVPAFFAFNLADQVVHSKNTSSVIDRWGGPTETMLLEQGPEDDEMGHVMAGDIFSPRQTAPLAERISAWLKSL